MGVRLSTRAGPAPSVIAAAWSRPMVNVCFAGITGRAASAIVAAIDDADDLT